MARSASISKDSILDAAEAIVCESGAAHMTMEGVADHAHVSKGGLMYIFPSKEALLKAMIARLIDRFEEFRKKVRMESFPDEVPDELIIEIKMLSNLDRTDSRRSAALLAVTANQPELIGQFQKNQRTRFSERLLSREHPERSTIAFLAAMGLHFTALLNIPILDQEQRMRTYENLIHLAAGELEL